MTTAYYKGMLKTERAARAYFFSRACAIMDNLGLSSCGGWEAGALSGPCREYRLMTEAGPMRVSIHDEFIGTQFDVLPLAARFVPVSTPSGKWNHHAFLSSRAHGRAAALANGAPEHLDAILAQFAAGLAKLKPYSVAEAA